MSGIRSSIILEGEILAILEEVPLDNNEDTDIESDDDLDFSPIFTNTFAGELDNQLIHEEVSKELDEELQEELEELLDDHEYSENMENIPGCSHWEPKRTGKRKAEDEPNRQWKLKDCGTKIPEYSLPEGPVEGMFENCIKATDFFLTFLEDIIENIVQQSNLYAVQKNKILDLKKGELLAFIGINFLMGYHKLPSWRHYWSESDDLRVSIVRKTMSRNRFDAILSNLHVADNSLIPKWNKDRLFKLRPMIDSLNEKFGIVYHGTRQLSVDESMILFKGRNSMKQYNPMKPIKRGYKLWCLADQHGYIKKFNVYQGKDEQLENKYKDFGLGERVVLSMTERELGKDKIIIFDNYFTSVRLLEKLKTEKTLACGTIRANRKGNPKNLKDDKKMKRGDVDFRCSRDGISFFKWKDNKAVLLASNYHGSEQTTVARRDQKGVQHDISCPTVVKDYNAFMGGVDHADQLRASYGLNRRSKKWWHRIFWGILEITFVNSYVVYCQVEEKISLLEYKRCVTNGLMSQQNLTVDTRMLKRRSLNDDSPQCSKKRRGKKESVSKDIRLGNLGIHWPKFVDARGRCEMCSINKVQSKPYSKCSHCNVFLCCNDKKNCFAKYHGINL